MEGDKNDDGIPLVTVALPIYNEAKHIRETLESITAQDFSDMEIIITDNHSTDGTGEICREYAGKDPRIQYYCHASNVGASANHLFAAHKARGEYFMWAGGHDKWSPNLVSQCVQLLESNSRLVIAFGTPVWVDDNEQPLQKYSGWYDIRGMNAVARFFMVFWGRPNPILGMFRRKAMPDLINKKYNYPGTDLVILSELALKGEFAHATMAIFYRRQNRSPENHNNRMQRYKSKEMKIGDTFLLRLFPLAQLPFELLKVVLRAQVAFLEKISIIMILIPSLPIRYIMGKRDSNVG